MNPLQTLATVQNYQGNALRNQVLGAGLAANQAQSQAVIGATDPATGQVDWGKALASLSQNPQGAYNAPAFAQSVQAMKTGQVGLDSATQKLAMQRAANVAQFGVSILSNPNATGQDYVIGIQNMVQNGQIDPQSGINAVAHAAPYLNDPAALKRYVTMGLSSLPPEIQAAYVKPTMQTINTGGQTNIVATNPLTGAPTITGSMNNTLSPEAQVARVPTFANGQPGSVPQGSLAPPNLLPAAGGGSGAASQPPPLPTIPTPPGMPTSSAAGVPPLPSGPAPGAPTAAAPVPPGFIPSGPALGANARADTTAVSDATMGQNLVAQGDAQPAQIAALKNMRADLANFTAGPTSGSWLALKQLAGQYKITTPEMQQSVASQEGFNKLAANLVSAQSATMGTPTDHKVLVAESGNPNATLSNLGNREMINYLISNAQFMQAKARAWTAAQSGPTPPTYAQFQDTWNKTSDPAVFQYANMQAAQRTAYLNSLSSAEIKEFQRKGNIALQAGWVTPGQ